MFCPSCGLEERQLSQFCRGCGTDLRAVRAGLERPDAITNSAATAREEIGRAIAEKIKELRGSTELKTMAEDVLPKIEEFLESPEEKRLRRMRKGVMTTAAGLGAMLMFLLLALVTRKEEMLIPIGAASVAFIIGLGMIINGKLLTVQKKQLPGGKQDASLQSPLDRLQGNAAANRGVLQPPATPPLSVIEHTTHRLSNNPKLAGALQSKTKAEDSRQDLP
jgi:hypothetical protein